MDKRKRKPIAVDISNWGGRSIVYECPNCHTSFRLMGDKERFCYFLFHKFIRKDTV